MSSESEHYKKKSVLLFLIIRYYNIQYQILFVSIIIKVNKFIVISLHRNKEYIFDTKLPKLDLQFFQYLIQR